MLSLQRFFDVPARRTLFHAMLDKLGLRDAITSLDSSAAVMARADKRCADCGREDSCAVWLAETVQSDEAPYFCKNHDLFERVKHDIETGIPA